MEWSDWCLMTLDPKVADCDSRCPNSRSRSWRLALPITIPLELSSDKKSLEGDFGTAIWWITLKLQTTVVRNVRYHSFTSRHTSRAFWVSTGNFLVFWRCNGCVFDFLFYGMSKNRGSQIIKWLPSRSGEDWSITAMDEKLSTRADALVWISAILLQVASMFPQKVNSHSRTQRR